MASPLCPASPSRALMLTAAATATAGRRPRRRPLAAAALTAAAAGASAALLPAHGGPAGPSRRLQHAFLEFTSQGYRGIAGSSCWHPQGSVAPQRRQSATRRHATSTAVDARRELAGWIRSRGGFVSEGLASVWVEGKGLAVQVTRDFAAEETLLIIPGCLDIGASLEGREASLLPVGVALLKGEEHLLTRLAAHIALSVARQAQAPAGEAEGSGGFAPFWKALDLDTSVGHMSDFWSSELQAELLTDSERAGVAKRQRSAQLVAELIGPQEGMGQLNSEGAMGSFNATRYLMAKQLMHTHSFSDDIGRWRLVPLAIDINHAVEGLTTARWRWDASRDALVIFTKRAMRAGDEVTISYGFRSNADLFSIYGFTLEPRMEPLFTYDLGPAGQLLPESANATVMNSRVSLITVPFTGREPGDPRPAHEPLEFIPLETKVDFTLGKLGALRELLDRVRAAGGSSSETLEGLVSRSIDDCLSDEQVAAFAEGLRFRRARQPKSWSWWLAPGGDELDASGAEALGSRQRSDVVRSRVSGYICLLSYREALALRRGDMPASNALPQAVALQPLLDRLLVGP